MAGDDSRETPTSQKVVGVRRLKEAMAKPASTRIFTIYEVLMGDAQMVDVVKKVAGFPVLDCVSSNTSLANAEINLVSMVARELQLKEAIESISVNYDYIFIDCPPSLGLLTINAFAASKELLIPIQTEYYALEGLSQLLETYGVVKKRLNPNLNLSTIVLTMFDSRTRLSNDVAANVRAHFPNELIDIPIPRAVRVSEAPSYNQTVMTYDPVSDNKYELIMGERRFRAAKAAGLTSIPVIIRQTPDNELLRDALIENIHRSNLNPLEEGAAYAQLLSDFGCTHDELALKLGRSRPLISNTIRLLNLPDSVQRKVAAGVISAGHARALLGLTDANEIEKLASRIVAEGLSVRAIEEIIATMKPSTKATKKSAVKGVSGAGLAAAELLSDYLDTRVSVESGKGKGKIVIEFAGNEDLQRIVDLIEGK